MATTRGHRGGRENSWIWESSPEPRPRPARWLASRWTVPFGFSILVGLLLLLTSFGGNAQRGTLPQSCSDASLQVGGQLTGSVTWCAPEGTQVQAAEGIIAVHYPGNENPCHFAAERGPGDGWFEVAGNYRLVLIGPKIPGQIAAAQWSFSFEGPFSLCGDENAMRVTIILSTNLAGATAWVQDFGVGAFGDRSESFKPTPQATPTPTPSTRPTSTASPTPTLSPMPTASPTPTGSPSHTPLNSATPTPASTPTMTPSPGPTSTSTPSMTATPQPTPSASSTPPQTLPPTPSPTAHPTPTATPPVSTTPTPSPTPTVIPPWVMSPVPTALTSFETPAPSGFPKGGAGGYATAGAQGMIGLALIGIFLIILSAGIMNWPRRR